MNKRMSEERRQKYQDIYDNVSNTYNLAPNIKNFLMRMAEEKINVVRSQNVVWMGFAKAPFNNDIENADIVIAGFGFDLGTHQETGDMRHAPNYIRAESRQIVPVNHEWDIAPYEMCSVMDMGDVDVQGLNADEQIDYALTYANRITKADALPLFFGGEHTVAHVTYQSLANIVDKHFDGQPMGGLNFDGHYDMMTAKDAYTTGSRNNGNFFAMAIAEGKLDPEKFFMFGMRDWGIGAPVGMAAAQEFGVTNVTPREVEEKGCRYWVDLMRERWGDSPIWLSTDLDGLDPVDSGGGLSARDSFGLTWREYRMLTRALKGKNLIGCDISEYSPAHDITRTTGIGIAHYAFEILCMMTETKVRLNGGKFNQTKWPVNLSTAPGYFGEQFLDEWKKEK